MPQMVYSRRADLGAGQMRRIRRLNISNLPLQLSDYIIKYQSDSSARMQGDASILFVFQVSRFSRWSVESGRPDFNQSSPTCNRYRPVLIGSAAGDVLGSVLHSCVQAACLRCCVVLLCVVLHSEVFHGCAAFDQAWERLE